MPDLRFSTPVAPELMSDYEYDRDLILELVTIFTRYAGLKENRLMGQSFTELLRLIRANPAQTTTDLETFYRLRTPDYERFRQLGVEDNIWLPVPAVAFQLRLSGQHPLRRMLKAHFRPDHRVWRYLT